MRGITVDLNDRGLIRIELPPGEIRPEQEQRVAVKDGVIAGRTADNAGHPDVVRIVILDEVLAARRVGHRRLQPRRSRDHLVMRARAARTGIDRDCLALVENSRNLVEVRVGRADEWQPRMNGIGRLVLRRGIGDVCRDDEHSDATLRQGCLTCRDGFTPGLLRRQDHLAIDAASLKHVVEIDLLDRFEP